MTTEQAVALMEVVRDTFWMARRYANQRKTYAPHTVNRALKTLEEIGIEIDDDASLVQDGNSNSRTLDV